ncbi:amidohydrolase family protein [Candidatus Poribacteria bacterium]|nr:amidohydrolase family protein [Candidatus Poribacteria bacterium]
MRIIDNHIHCGDNIHKSFTIKDVEQNLREAGADGAVIFAFPEDMYRIEDSREWRIRANNYVLELSRISEMEIYPFYFVWNDYIIPDNLNDYVGIKWHRHWDEPRYDYDDPRCDEMLKAIKELNLPVLIEEEYQETVNFVQDNPELNIIIPHMGGLNGGCDKMDIFFDNPNIYFDTSTASPDDISRILDNVGADRVIFGSDVSGTSQPFFNFTKVELEKFMQMDIDHKYREKILSGNIESLVSKS